MKREDRQIFPCPFILSLPLIFTFFWRELVKVQKHNCPSCGAPLSVGSNIVNCEHCGSHIKISGHTGELKQIGQSKPVIRRAPMSKAKKRTIIISLILLIAVSVVALKIYNGYNWIRTVNSVAWSPDGRRIVSVHGQGLAARGSLRVWDAASGNELNASVNKDTMWQAAWSPDGRYMAVGQHDGAVEVWNTESMQVIQKLKGSASYVDNLSWSPDSKRIAVGDDKGRLRVWNVESGDALYSELIHSNRIDDLAWSPDGRMIAAGGWDNMIRVVDAATAKQLFAIQDTSYVNAVSWSPDGKFLASGGLSNLVKIIDAAGGKELFTLSGHKNSVRQVAWSPDGKLVASVASDSTIRVWDAFGGKILQILDNPGYNQNLQWSPDGSHIASGGRGSVRIWENRNWAATTLSGYSSDNDVRIAGWSADGKQLLTIGTYDDEITLWDVAQEKKIHTMQVGYLEAFRRSLF